MNYGHFDLLVGDRAPQEIYPLVLDWLDAHAGTDLPRRPSSPAEPAEPAAAASV